MSQEAASCSLVGKMFESWASWTKAASLRASGERLHLWSCMHHYVSGHSRYLSWRFLYDMYPYVRAIVRPMQWNISPKPCFQYLHFRIRHGPLNMYHLYWFAQPQGHSLRQIILSHPNCAWHSCGPNSKAFSSCRAWQASVTHWRTKRKSSHIWLNDWRLTWVCLLKKCL